MKIRVQQLLSEVVSPCFVNWNCYQIKALITGLRAEKYVMLEMMETRLKEEKNTQNQFS